MRCLTLFPAVLAAVALPALSQAVPASSTPFQVNATFVIANQPQTHTVSGTVMIDTTTGKVGSVQLTYDGIAAASVGDGGSVQYGTADAPVTGITETWLSSSGRGGYSAVALVLPAASLIGYAGGTLCSQAHPCTGQPMSSFIKLNNSYFLDGQITPVTPTASTSSTTQPQG